MSGGRGIPTAMAVPTAPIRISVRDATWFVSQPVGMLLLPLTTPLLIVSGLLGGASGALVMTPILVELSHRSSDADRGSAFALFSGGLAAAMSLGSIGGAPLVAIPGMSAALGVGILLIGVSIGLTLADPSLKVKRGGVPPPDPEGPTHSHADLEPAATAR